MKAFLDTAVTPFTKCVDGFCHAHPGHIVPATYATPAKPCSGLHELWVELNNDGETPSGMLLNAQLTCK